MPLLFCRRQALAEFEMYRQRMEDSQLCTEAQHTQRVVSMSREVRLRTRIHMHARARARTHTHAGLAKVCKALASFIDFILNAL